MYAEIEEAKKKELAMKDRKIELLQKELELTRLLSNASTSADTNGVDSCSETSQGFSFKDIEGSINSFSDNDFFTVGKWL